MVISTMAKVIKSLMRQNKDSMKVSVIVTTVLVLLVTFAASQFVSPHYPHHLLPQNLRYARQNFQNEGIPHRQQLHPLAAATAAGIAVPRQIQQDLPVEFTPTCSYAPEDFKIIGSAIERALIFFEANVGKLVMDAAVGTRILEAQLGSILKSHRTLPQPMEMYLHHLMGKAARISEKIAQTIGNNGKLSPLERQYNLPWITTPGLWEWPIAGGSWEGDSIMKSYEPPEGMNISSILARSKETIAESQSDSCIYQTFNCETSSVSDACRRLFLEEEQSLYSLTHQVIYSLFAAKRKCYGTQDATKAQEWRKFQEKLCGKVWLEANAIDRTGFPAKFRDLFVEQVAICGMTGYPNFMKQEWLRQILSWQSRRRSGCFLDQRVEVSNVAQLLRLYRQNQQKFHDMIQMQNFKVTSRQKRSDAYLRQGSNENCSVHFTAVGVSALALHLRYFFDTCLTSY